MKRRGVVLASFETSPLLDAKQARRQEGVTKSWVSGSK